MNIFDYIDIAEKIILADLPKYEQLPPEFDTFDKEVNTLHLRDIRRKQYETGKYMFWVLDYMQSFISVSLFIQSSGQIGNVSPDMIKEVCISAEARASTLPPAPQPRRPVNLETDRSYD